MSTNNYKSLQDMLAQQLLSEINREIQRTLYNNPIKGSIAEKINKNIDDVLRAREKVYRSKISNLISH